MKRHDAKLCETRNRGLSTLKSKRGIQSVSRQGQVFHFLIFAECNISTRCSWEIRELIHSIWLANASSWLRLAGSHLWSVTRATRPRWTQIAEGRMKTCPSFPSKNKFSSSRVFLSSPLVHLCFCVSFRFIYFFLVCQNVVASFRLVAKVSRKIWKQLKFLAVAETKKLNKKCEHRDDGMERLIGSGIACVGSLSLLDRKTKQLCPRTFANLLLIVYRRSWWDSRFGIGRRNCHQDRRCNIDLRNDELWWMTQRVLL